MITDVKVSMHLPIEIIDCVCNYLTIKEICRLSTCDTYTRTAVMTNRFFSYCHNVFVNENQPVIINLMKDHRFFFRFYASLPNKFCHKKLFYYACIEGHTSIVNLLSHQKKKLDKNFLSDTFMSVCKIGKPSVANLLISLVKHPYEIYVDGIKEACIGNNQEMIKFLYTKINETSNYVRPTYYGGWQYALNFSLNHIFEYSCENGYLDSAKQVLELATQKTQLLKNDYALRWVCIKGQLDTFIWLIEIYLQYNLDLDPHELFRHACEFGHLKIVKWLYYTYDQIDMRAWNDYAFRCACSKGHSDVVQFLCAICPSYVILKQTIPIKYRIRK